ncbi:MAG: DUF6950 family protein [Rhodanobacter sp.]
MRKPDWANRLRETVAANRRVPFAYGQNDCALFAARCVDAITGSDWERSLPHKDIKTAAAFRREEGGLEAAVPKRLGNPIPGCGARRGDLCLIDRKSIGVCLGSQIAVLSDNRLLFYPITRARKHWRID